MGTEATLAERDLRYRRIREAMEAEGLQALVAAGHASHFRRGYIRYLTNAHMWAGDALILLPLEGDPTVAWVSYAGGDRIPDGRGRGHRDWNTGCESRF